VVWIEKDLFSSKPDFNKLKKETYPCFSKEEQDFIDGPVNELCKLVNDWEICQKREIPKKYGGLGFSALA
jgi:acyl-CoA dehydrogenase